MIYIQKDVNETLDYVFIRNVEDNIVGVSYIQDGSGGLVVADCLVNSGSIITSDGIEYPAGRAIVLWVSGGTVGQKEKVVLTYTTAAGRVRDESVVFSFIQDN